MNVSHEDSTKDERSIQFGNYEYKVKNQKLMRFSEKYNRWIVLDFIESNVNVEEVIIQILSKQFLDRAVGETF